MARVIFFIILFSLLFVGTARAVPPQRDDVSGTINFEGEDLRKDSFSLIQDKVINSIKTSTLSKLSQAEIVYLNSAYLYCTVHKGVCAEILDAILAADFNAAKVQNQSTCPMLESFWKLWVQNQFEDRQRYMGKITYFSQTNDFNMKKRNTYIKCRETIAQMLNGQIPAPAADVNAKAVAVLEQIKVAVPNVITAVGAQGQEKPAENAESPAAAPRSNPNSSAREVTSSK